MKIQPTKMHKKLVKKNVETGDKWMIDAQKLCNGLKYNLI